MKRLQGVIKRQTFFTDDQGRVEEKPKTICHRCSLFEKCVDRRIYERVYCSDYKE